MNRLSLQNEIDLAFATLLLDGAAIRFGALSQASELIRTVFTHKRVTRDRQTASGEFRGKNVCRSLPTPDRQYCYGMGSPTWWMLLFFFDAVCGRPPGGSVFVPFRTFFHRNVFPAPQGVTVKPTSKTRNRPRTLPGNLAGPPTLESENTILPAQSGFS